MKKILFILINAVLLSIPLYSIVPCRLDDKDLYLELGKEHTPYEIWYDTGRDTDIIQVMKKEFRQGPEDMNHLFHEGRLWIHFVIQSGLQDRAEIIIDSVETETDQIDFYIVDKSGDMVHYPSGRTRSVDSYRLKGWKMAVPVQLEPEEAVDVYISFASGFLVRTPVRISLSSVFFHTTVIDTLITVLLLGGFLALFSNHLVLFVSTRNPLFLYSSLYIFFICIYLAAIENFLHAYIFTGEGFISRILLPRFNLVMPLLALIFLLKYQRAVLGLIHKAILLEKIMKYLSIMLMGFILFQYFFPFMEKLYPVYLFLYLGAIILVISPIIYFRHLSENGRIFLVSLIPLAVLIFIQQFQNLGMLSIDPITPFPVYTGETFFIGLLFQVLILSMLTSSLLRDKDRNEQQLEYERNLAEKNYRVKNRMVQNMSHEIKSNLNLMSSSLHKLNASQKEIRNDFNRYIKNITNYIKKAVSEEMVESENDRIEEIGLYDLLEEVRKDLMPLAEKKGQRILLKDSSSSFRLFSNLFMVRTIIRNLVDNAIKYGPEKSDIVLEISGGGNRVTLSVSDKGEGIPEEERSNIFNRAYRMEQHLKKGIDGMGLGLHISKEMAATLGGRLDYTYDSEIGSIFSLELKTSDKDEVPRAFLCSSVFDYNNIERGKKLILVVEDNWEMLANLVHVLNKDYQVKGALDGSKALDALTILSPDIIISDIMMPGIDGFTFINEFQRKFKDHSIPFLFLTAAEMIESRIRGLSLGAVDYMEKPFNMDELLLKIQNLLSFKEKAENSLLKDFEHYIQESSGEELPENGQDILADNYGLTKREKELLALYMEHTEEERIGELMGIQLETINSHKYSIYKKTGVSNMIELHRLFRKE